tara:strand:+ start:6417 stop:8504 length:2088 start_codon:yes stop_codon:yes gene_type:complete
MTKLPPLESSAKTAIGAGSSGTGGTVGSYIAADKLFTQKGGTKLDFGSGRGEGAQFIKADTYEPYVKSNPKYTTSGQIPSNSYDKITSLNVLNVIPPEQRKETVKEIARVLKPNGEAIISTRGKDVEAAKNKIKVKDGYVIGKGKDARFQKGFAVDELKKYVQKILGNNYVVQPIKGVGKAAIKITKGAGMNPLEDTQFGSPKPELVDVLDPTIKQNFNEGGKVMEKQMSLFQEGGLEQDGGTVDPVSGNEVPIGSAQEEVRDDIPAQLSEGEFVFPADVVRFIGLEKLMMLRQEAKAGLKKMEAMGQMGNSEEATIPDDMPFSSDDLIVGDDTGDGDLEMQVGGFVPPFGTQQQQGTGIYTQASQMGNQFNIQPQQTMQPSGMVSQQPVATGYSPTFVGGQQPVTTFDNLIPLPAKKYENIRFVNATGEVMIIPHVDDNPVFPVPEGYTRETQVQKDTEETLKSPTDAEVKTTTLTKPDPNLQRDPQREREEAEAQKKAIERSYASMVETAIAQSGKSSLEEITDYIKSGEVKAEIFGMEFKVPGITFNEAGIAKAYEDNKKLAGKVPLPKPKPPKDERTLVPTEEEIKIAQDPSDLPVPTVIQTQAKDEADAYLKQLEKRASQEQKRQQEKERRQEEKDAMRAKGDTTTNLTVAPSKASGLSREQQLRGIKQGGLLKKSKKKVMKQGGLASKK